MHVDRKSFGQPFLLRRLRVSDVEFDVAVIKYKTERNRDLSVLEGDAPSPRPVGIAENLDGYPKRTIVRRDECCGSLSRICAELNSVDFLDIRQLVWLKNSPYAHNVGMLGATGHGNPDSPLAVAHTNIGRLNHRPITGLPSRIDQ
jgi:hypothetical protein